MSPLPKISIVTPTFNSLSTLRETIESVRTQDYPEIEHIVMDGGSEDGTLDILREYPHLIWESEKDEGHYHAMNKGIARATGEIVAVLNADDRYRPGTSRAVGEAFAAHPDWDGLFGDIVYIHGNDEEIYRREEALYDYQTLLWSGVCYVVHPTLFVKKAIYDRLGAFRHHDFKNSADYEFILRLGKNGCRIGHLPRYLVTYRYHDDGQSADLRVTRNMARENGIIRAEYGCPDDGWDGLRRFYGRAKRQIQKLALRGKCDLFPASWTLKRHMKEATNFKSNIDFDKLPKS
jgi:glycosyltransferase involved in cell wall biosynthesis